MSYLLPTTCYALFTMRCLQSSRCYLHDAYLCNLLPTMRYPATAWYVLFATCPHINAILRGQGLGAEKKCYAVGRVAR
jgi:hypothetical protein